MKWYSPVALMQSIRKPPRRRRAVRRAARVRLSPARRGQEVPDSAALHNATRDRTRAGVVRLAMGDGWYSRATFRCGCAARQLRRVALASEGAVGRVAPARRSAGSTSRSGRPSGSSVAIRSRRARCTARLRLVAAVQRLVRRLRRVAAVGMQSRGDTRSTVLGRRRTVRV
jgi:hypothetical protein